MTMDDLPAVNVLVRVSTGPEDDHSYPSRVENVDAEGLWIAVPRFGGDEPEALPGSVFSVGWSTERGHFSLVAELVEVTTGALPLWQLRPAGPVERSERRRYARARAAAAVNLVPLRDTPVGVLTGSVRDLSEGGLSATVHGRVEAGESVIAHVALQERNLRADGLVLEVRHRDHGWSDLSIRFDEPVREEALIRRWVLHQQVLARRAGEGDA